MDAVLKWPMVECGACGFNLREKAPKANEKSNDANGILKWTDFCPKCGVGMFVGDRFLPAPTVEVLAERGAAPVISSGEEKGVKKDKGKASGIPPDERGAALAKTEEENPDPEGLLGEKPEASSEEKPEPGTIRPPREGEYFCTKCAGNHKDTDKLKSIGLRHKKYREA